MFALIASEELTDLGQIMVKQLKNRYNDPGVYTKFCVGVDRSKMRLYDVEQSAQDDIVGSARKRQEDKSVFDSSKFMTEDTERNKPKSKFDKSKFAGFK
jgi:hypothetical protein